MKRTLLRVAILIFLVGGATAHAPTTAFAQAVASDMCGQTATISGTKGKDRLKGTPGDDVIDGLGGDDVIYGLQGDDLICGGDGAEIIYMGRGYDSAYGGRGDDRIQGGGGPDFLFGEDGNDDLTDNLPQQGSSVSGGQGDDAFHGGEVSFEGSMGPVDVDLAAGASSGEGADTLDGVHIVSGSRLTMSCAGARSMITSTVALGTTSWPAGPGMTS